MSGHFARSTAALKVFTNGAHASQRTVYSSKRRLNPQTSAYATSRDSLRVTPHRTLCPFRQSHAMHMLMRRRAEHPLILAAEL